MFNRDVMKEEGNKETGVIVLGFIAVFVFLCLYTLVYDSGNTSYTEDACYSCDYQ